MRKRIKKIQLKQGYDAQKSVVRKLTTNFIMWGKLTTTERRVKYLKSIIDRLTYKAIRNTQADKDMLLSALNNKKMVEYMTTKVGSSFKDKKSGFTTIVKFGPRQGDGALTAQLSWVGAIEQFAPPVYKKPVAVAEKSSKIEDAEVISETPEKKA